MDSLSTELTSANHENSLNRYFFGSRADLVLLITLAFTCAKANGQEVVKVPEPEQAIVKRHIEWETTLSSPGVSLQAKEVNRQGSMVFYHIYAHGLPSFLQSVCSSLVM